MGEERAEEEVKKQICRHSFAALLYSIRFSPATVETYLIIQRRSTRKYALQANIHMFSLSSCVCVCNCLCMVVVFVEKALIHKHGEIII